MKIYAQPNGKLTEADMKTLASILFTAGYKVSKRKETIDGKTVMVVEVE